MARLQIPLILMSMTFTLSACGDRFKAAKSLGSSAIKLDDKTSKVNIDEAFQRQGQIETDPDSEAEKGANSGQETANKGATSASDSGQTPKTTADTKLPTTPSADPKDAGSLDTPQGVPQLIVPPLGQPTTPTAPAKTNPTTPQGNGSSPATTQPSTNTTASAPKNTQAAPSGSSNPTSATPTTSGTTPTQTGAGKQDSLTTDSKKTQGPTTTKKPADSNNSADTNKQAANTNGSGTNGANPAQGASAGSASKPAGTGNGTGTGTGTGAASGAAKPQGNAVSTGANTTTGTTKTQTPSTSTTPASLPPTTQGTPPRPSVGASSPNSELDGWEPSLSTFGFLKNFASVKDKDKTDLTKKSLVLTEYPICQKHEGKALLSNYTISALPLASDAYKVHRKKTLIDWITTQKEEVYKEKFLGDSFTLTHANKLPVHQDYLNLAAMEAQDLVLKATNITDLYENQTLNSYYDYLTCLKGENKNCTQKQTFEKNMQELITWHRVAKALKGASTKNAACEKLQYDLSLDLAVRKKSTQDVFKTFQKEMLKSFGCFGKDFQKDVITFIVGILNPKKMTFEPLSSKEKDLLLELYLKALKKQSLDLQKKNKFNQAELAKSMAVWLAQRVHRSTLYLQKIAPQLLYFGKATIQKNEKEWAAAVSQFYENSNALSKKRTKTKVDRVLQVPFFRTAMLQTVADSNPIIRADLCVVGSGLLSFPKKIEENTQDQSGLLIPVSFVGTAAAQAYKATGAGPINHEALAKVLKACYRLGLNMKDGKYNPKVCGQVKDIELKKDNFSESLFL